MRIDILAIGSRGDVQPVVALGVGLQRAGYSVRVVTLGGAEALVCGHGLDHLVIGGSPQEILRSAAGSDWIKNRSSTLGFLRGFVRVAASKIEEGIAAYWPACQDTEMLIVTPLGLPVGIHIAERLRLPLFRANPTAPAVATFYGSDGRRNLVTAAQTGWTAFLHTAFNFAVRSALRGSMNDARRRILDLPPIPWLLGDLKRLPLLCGYSSAVVPRPPDFGHWIYVTGYWFLEDPAGWTPSPELAAFLDSGPPPVFVGFGSTPFPRPEATAQLLIRAMARTGHRAVLVAGGSGLPTQGQLSPDILAVDSVPHGWLFSRVWAAVHHGGAGVTGAALRAGLPSVVVPVFADQPFWGKRVFELGAGPRPIPARRLTEDKLAHAILATANVQMRRRAAELGQQIRSENGVLRAVEIIDRHLGGGACNSMRQQHAR
jgi:sterol 3beta-glucosyltransferase